MRYASHDDGLWLFSHDDLGAVLRHHLSSIQQAVDSLPEDALQLRPDDDLVDELEHRLSLRPLELLEDEKSVAATPTSIDITHNPNYFHFPGSSGEVPGYEVRISIPYRGDKALWRCRPNQWRSVTPRGEINGGVLDIVIKQPGQVKAEDVTKELKSALEGIKFYLDAQRAQINSELAQLPAQIRGAIAKRRARNSEIANLSAVLGIRGTPKPTTPAPAKTTVSKATPKQVREVEWDVFISHASGDKDDFVRPLANALKARGLRVWFDEFTLTIGDSLRREIDKGLKNSRFGIVVISPAFLAKEWPQKELDGLVTRELDGKKVVLPIWHNVDMKAVRDYSPMLADRLAASSARKLEEIVDELIAAIERG